MKIELFPFQKKAVADLRMKAAEAMGSYRRTYTPQVVSLQAPTGAGKTIIMAALVEYIYFGTDQYMIYICSRCLFMFKRSDEPDACLDCGSPNVRQADDDGIKEYIRNKEQVEKIEP